MDKQMIEEMAKDMLNYAMEYYPKDMSAFTETTLREHFYHLYLGYAQYLIKAGYRKIPKKNTVALTREEVDEISETAIKNSRKGTAEKFAKRLVDWFVDKTAKHPDKLWLIITLAEWHKMIDEITKEFTEG